MRVEFAFRAGKVSRPRFGVSGSCNHPKACTKMSLFKRLSDLTTPTLLYQQFSGYSIGVPTGDPAVSIHERMNRPSNFYELERAKKSSSASYVTRSRT